MTDKNFTIGDRVRIREWDDMVNEFGERGGEIPCRCTFVSNMEQYCGKEVEIVYICGSRISISPSFGYTFSTDMIEHLSVVHPVSSNVVKDVKCANCSQILPRRHCGKSSSGKYVCRTCSSIKNSSVKSTNQIHKPTKSHKTYGFELECYPNSNEDKLSMINSVYGLIPTCDGSLSTSGIEFKTPIYNGLRGLRKLFTSFNKYVSFEDESCGQHINIGDTEHIDAYSTSEIRQYAYELFNPLYNHMESNRADTERVCGRYFTDYAEKESSYTDHCSWIALSETQRIEFRLSKFVNANQYFELTCMWTEMLDCIIENFLPSYNAVSARTTSKMLIEIFKKYADGKAKSQQYKKAKLAA